MISDTELIDALYREKFDAFAERAFAIANPAVQFEYNWHIGCIGEHLEAMYAGEISRLIINLPPRSLKSFLVSSAFPAWVLGKRPFEKFINTGYGLTVVEQNARICKMIMRSEWYQRLFPETIINPELDRVLHFETTQRGQFYGDTALSTITGVGCFVSGTLIDTNIGLIPINKLRQACNSDTLIRSFNHKTGEQEYKPVTDWVEKKTNQVIEIQTHGGRVIRCTANHEIYVQGRGYIRADDVHKNDRVYLSDSAPMRLVQETTCNSIGGYEKKNTPRTFIVSLFKKMLPDSKKQVCLKNKGLQNLQQTIYIGKKGKLPKQILFKRLRRKKLQKVTTQKMRWVQKSFLSKLIQSSLLFPLLRRQASFSQDAGAVQSKFQKQKPVLQSGIQESAKNNFGKRRLFLRNMRDALHDDKGAWVKTKTKNKFNCSSYRRQSLQQRFEKLNNNVHSLPYNTSQIAHDTISSIKRISGNEISVYDITVADNHNYYANGVLVHNCSYMTIDDPLKPMEAFSDTVRNSTNQNIRATLMNRFDDRRIGKLLIVMQRVHEDDTTGNLLKDGGYTHLKLPAEAKSQIVINLKDHKWEMQQNDLLFPARLSREELDKIRLDMTELHFVGQYLQEPVPVGGGEFKSEWVQHYNQGACKPRDMNICILVDPAGGEDLNRKKRKLSDWTAMGVIGFAPDGNRYVLDIIRDRLNPTDRIDTLFTLHRKWLELSGKGGIKVGYERYSMQSDIHYIRKKMADEAYNFPLVELGGNVMKEERIRRMIPDMQQGRWFFPQSLVYVDCEGRKFDLIRELIDSEMASFPRARFDDMLDMLSRSYEPELNMVFPKPKNSMVTKAIYSARSERTDNNWENW